MPAPETASNATVRSMSGQPANPASTLRKSFGGPRAVASISAAIFPKAPFQPVDPQRQKIPARADHLAQQFHERRALFLAQILCHRISTFRYRGALIRALWSVAV